nr:MAG TPA: hypothetical protein [Caudoviricetes sp.]
MPENINTFYFSGVKSAIKTACFCRQKTIIS